MTTPGDSPVLLGPSLGCPRILTLNKGATEEPLFAVLASDSDISGRWSLVPSASNGNVDLTSLPLRQGEAEELPTDPGLPTTVDETRDFVSRECVAGAPGEKTRIFKVRLHLPELDPERVLRKIADVPRPTLYDLVWENGATRRKPHAVCLTTSTDRGPVFIHLTDLHLARRNDLMEVDLGAVVGAIPGFNNMNDRMREFIRTANGMADRGELDLVLLGGDIVDFTNHGVSDSGDEADNNWDLFREMLTGAGNEAAHGNTGLRVPVFTTTGNHDWRLHPYDTGIGEAPSTLRLTKAQAGEFDWEYFDRVGTLEAKKKAVFDRIAEAGSPIRKQNRLAEIANGLFRYSRTWEAKTLVPVVSFIFARIVGECADPSYSVAVSAAAFLAHAALNKFLGSLIRTLVTGVVIPIEADVRSLHKYLLEVNPYFNYAFSFRGHRFIVMDTGPDCLTAQYLWDEGNKKMARISVRDNIIGGSPDSMGFYPENEYYTFGQIAWLENVLKIVGGGKDAGGGERRIFVCLHAPPINVEKDPDFPPGRREVEFKDPRVAIWKWRPKLLFWRPDIRHGTVNHYVSQFLHLCLGRKEGDDAYCGPKADIVFSGHAHKKIEFRIAHGLRGPEVFCGPYSEDVKPAEFNGRRPFVIQTAACGPWTEGFADPPYFRVVRVGAQGEILGFAQRSGGD